MSVLMHGMSHPVTPASDLVVVGGGAIGCAIAYHAAAAGLRVTLVERGQLASGASGAAAGMLAPQVEAHYPDDFFSLCLAGREEYAMVAAMLRDEADIDVDYRQTGILRVALEERDAVDLRGRCEWQQQRGLAATWMDPHEVGQIEPVFAGAAGRRLVGALWLSDEAQVRSSRLVHGLAVAAARRGAALREATPVVELLAQSGHVTGVRTPSGTISAGVVVLAAGAWSATVAATVGVPLAIEPIKGQILALRAVAQGPRHIVWSHGCYITPKVDGQLVIGATEERAGFDSRPTMSGMLQLALAATEVIPELGRLPIDTQWGGLRPATSDRLPVIGWAPGCDGLFLATAHYRNGVLLGPLTGRLVTEMVRGETPSHDLSAYRPERLLEMDAAR